MKKDKEWLKKELSLIEDEAQKILDKYDDRGPTVYRLEERLHSVNFFRHLLDQLEEPEVLSSDWIKDNQSMWTSTHGSEYYVPSNKLYGKIVPKKEVAEEHGMNESEWAEVIGRYKWHLEKEGYAVIEKPAVPQFVADWIEETKKQRKSLVFAIAHIYDKNEIDESPSEKENRIFQWMELYDNDEVFSRAWLDGYKVEEEPRYYVVNSEGYLLLGRDKGHGFIFSTGGNYKVGSTERTSATFELTEQEIKDYDPDIGRSLYQ